MEKKHHILFISSWYPNKNDPTHGIFNKYFAQAAAINNKISVLHVCSSETLSTEFECVACNENGIETWIVYYKKIHSSFPFISLLTKRNKSIKAYNLGYKKLTEKVGVPDLIQLNVVMPAGIGAYHLSKKQNLPYVINEGWTGYCPEDGSYKGLLLKYFTKKIVSHAKALMPVSNFLKQAMLAHNLKGNYFILPNVVDTELFVIQDVVLEEATTKYLHISSLDEKQKNVSGIIRAFEKACRQNSNLKLTIVGDSEEKTTLQALVRELNVEDSVQCKGHVLGKELVNEINAHHALIMFSNYETFCLVVAEALACGKPVIASRAGGLTSEINPTQGIIVDKREEGQLRDAIINFALNKNKYNKEALRAFILKYYTKEKIGRTLTEVYDFALTKNST
jgi:L-malate glycosyltransferase